MHKVLIASVLGCTLLSSCATKIQRVEVASSPIEKPTITLPKADELHNLPVEWKILTPENFESQVEIIRRSGRPIAFFALTDEGYGNLGLNISSIRAYIQQQQAIITAYENYYQKANEALDLAEEELQEKEEKSWLFWRD